MSDSALRALVDVRFKRRATPRLVRWLYLTALVWIGGAAFLLVNLVLWFANWLGDSFMVFLPAVACGALWTLMAVRVACEWVLAAVGEPVPDRPSRAPDLLPVLPVYDQTQPDLPVRVQPPGPPVAYPPLPQPSGPPRPMWSQPQAPPDRQVWPPPGPR